MVADPQSAAKRILDRDAIGWGEVRLVARAYQEAIEALRQIADSTSGTDIAGIALAALASSATPTPTKENNEKGTA